MKRILVAISILLSLSSSAWAVTGAVITASTVTTDKIQITITTAPTVVDTTYICAFVGTSTDTTFIAIVDSTATSYLMTGLTERTKYIVFELTRDGSDHTAISNKVTVVTYKNQIQDVTQRKGYNQIRLYSSSSWLKNDKYKYEANSWTLTGVGATGKSMLFRGQPYVSLTLIGTAASDSISCTAYVRPVWINSEALSDSTMWLGARVDSLQIGAPGAPTEGMKIKQLTLPTFGLYLLELATYTDHVSGTIWAIITRDDDKE